MNQKSKWNIFVVVADSNVFFFCILSKFYVDFMLYLFFSVLYSPFPARNGDLNNSLEHGIDDGSS